MTAKSLVITQTVDKYQGKMKEVLLPSGYQPVSCALQYHYSPDSCFASEIGDIVMFKDLVKTCNHRVSNASANPSAS